MGGLPSDQPVINLDKLTYAGNLKNLAALKHDERHLFIKGDICDAGLVGKILNCHKLRAILHFAAESHMDHSIYGPTAFINTNVNGTFTLLEQACAFWHGSPEVKRSAFRFLHISTNEVYGSLELEDSPFTEQSAYAPNSPYSTSKAASDHLVRAYCHTYSLPTTDAMQSTLARLKVNWIGNPQRLFSVESKRRWLGLLQTPTGAQRAFGESLNGLN